MIAVFHGRRATHHGWIFSFAERAHGITAPASSQSSATATDSQGPEAA